MTMMLANIQILQKTCADFRYALAFAEINLAKLHARIELIRRVVSPLSRSGGVGGVGSGGGGGWGGSVFSNSLNICQLPFQLKLAEEEYNASLKQKNAIANRVYLDYYELYRAIKKYAVDVAGADAGAGGGGRGVGRRLVRNMRGKESDADIAASFDDVFITTNEYLGGILALIDAKDADIFVCEHTQLFGLNNGILLANMNHGVSSIREKYGLFVNGGVCVLQTHISLLTRLAVRVRTAYEDYGGDVDGSGAAEGVWLGEKPVASSPLGDNTQSIADGGVAAQSSPKSGGGGGGGWKHKILGVLGFLPKTASQKAKTSCECGALELIEKELEVPKIYECDDVFMMENEGASRSLCSSKSLPTDEAVDAVDSEIDLYDLETMVFDGDCSFVDMMDAFAFVDGSDGDSERSERIQRQFAQDECDNDDVSNK